jgi:hypothetical protein
VKLKGRIRNPMAELKGNLEGEEEEKFLVPISQEFLFLSLMVATILKRRKIDEPKLINHPLHA